MVTRTSTECQIISIDRKTFNRAPFAFLSETSDALTERDVGIHSTHGAESRNTGQ